MQQQTGSFEFKQQAKMLETCLKAILKHQDKYFPIISFGSEREFSVKEKMKFAKIIAHQP